MNAEKSRDILYHDPNSNPQKVNEWLPAAQAREAKLSEIYNRRSQLTKEKKAAKRAERRKGKKQLLHHRQSGPTVADTLPAHMARLAKVDTIFARRNTSTAGVRYARNPDKRIISANIVPSKLGYPTVKNRSGETDVLATSNDMPVIPRVARGNPVTVMRRENNKLDPYDLQFQRISPSRASWIGAEQAILPISVLGDTEQAEIHHTRRRKDRIQ